jgi:hypothetical protein
MKMWESRLHVEGEASQIPDRKERAMKKLLLDGIVIGSAASILSSCALLLLGRRENGSACAPTNAISHWLWRDRAFRKNGFSLRYTVAGYLIHHAMSIFWGTIHAGVHARRKTAASPGAALAAGMTTSAVACFVDYRLTPKRLRPGFEERLSTPAMAGVYLAFGAGLAIASIVLARKG